MAVSNSPTQILSLAGSVLVGQNWTVNLTSGGVTTSLSYVAGRIPSIFPVWPQGCGM
jgi:hypothetical protein